MSPCPFPTTITITPREPPKEPIYKGIVPIQDVARKTWSQGNLCCQRDMMMMMMMVREEYLFVSQKVLTISSR